MVNHRMNRINQRGALHFILLLTVFAMLSSMLSKRRVPSFGLVQAFTFYTSSKPTIFRHTRSKPFPVGSPAVLSFSARHDNHPRARLVGRKWSSKSHDDDESTASPTLEMTNIYQEWTLDQDQLLWNGHERDGKSLVELAVALGRGLGGVQARLKKLQDVNSPAYERCFVNPPKNGNKKKSKSQQADEEETKKNKLVPVSEVLRRIQWDYQLNEEDFSILHYDRVEDNLIESSVNALNENIAGNAKKLVDALPEHRIMAVKFRERLVWDRNERLDLMFGSGNSKTENAGAISIEQVVETYADWLQEREQKRLEAEQKWNDVSNTARQVLGAEKMGKLEMMVSNLLINLGDEGDCDPAPTILHKTDVEAFVTEARQIFRDIREDPSGSLDPTKIPMSDYQALDLLSEWVALLPAALVVQKQNIEDDTKKNAILQEIDSRMHQVTKKVNPQKQKQQLPKNRPLPTIEESDLTENFVRGSGPGGQKINKTNNKVLLIHEPTQLRVECQDTRSLQQNRKIARRRLREKLDDYLHGSQSKAQQAAQKISIRKAKAKAKNRARHKQRQQEKQQQSDKTGSS